MAPPVQGTILYRFAPPGDNWTGTEEHTYHCYTYGGQNYCHGSSISDAYDFNTTSDTVVDYGAPDTYAWKQTSNIGSIQRVKCSFSLDTLPPSDGYQSIVGITFHDHLDSDPDNWDWEVFVYVKPDGALTFNTFSGPDSISKISAGISYSLELYVIYDNLANTSTWQIWIDGNLWLSVSDALSWSSEAYTQLIAGLESNWYRGICDVTLHIEDIVWTIEGIGLAGWTMMAPGIG